MILLSVDPGTEQSGWSEWNVHKGLEGCLAMGISPNEHIREKIYSDSADFLVIEDIVSYGQVMGQSTIQTIMWIGRFIESFMPRQTNLMSRRVVKQWLTDAVNTKDKNVNQVVLDRMGGFKSTKKRPNPMMPLPYPHPSSHEWSALALAITWMETEGADLVE